MKLSDWAEKQGISYTTAWRWFKFGKLPAKAIKTPSGSIIVEDEPVVNSSEVVIYCRVSNMSRKDELKYQVERCVNYANAKGYQVSKIYKEIASGMNDNRKELWRMLDSKPGIVIIENKDRLTRFGYNYIERLMKNVGCKIECMNPNKDDEQDLIKDLISIITSFCCRLYGMRRSKNKIDKIKQVLDDSQC